MDYSPAPAYICRIYMSGESSLVTCKVNGDNFGHSIGNDVQYDVGHSASFLSECPKLPTCPELPPFTLPNQIIYV